MKKRLLFLVPAVAMLLAGCGKNGGDPTSTSGVTPTTEQPSTSGVEPTSQSGTPTEPGPDSSSSVEPAPDVEPAEIYLSPSNRANLIVGDTMQFTAEVRNQAHSAEGVDQRVTWEIAAADEGKYTCVNGLVTAVAPGQDMILTVKSVAKDTVTKTITININKADRALPSETSDGFSLLTSANLNSFENGSEVYFAGVVEDDVWMAKAQSGNNVPAEKAEVNEGGKLVPSANAVKWVVSFNADETVTFTRNSKVLYTPNTGNHLKETATDVQGVEEAMYHFELTDLDAQGNAVAKSKYVSDKGADQTANVVRFNNTNKYDGQLSPIFSAYKPTSSVTHTFAMYFKAPVVLNRIEVKTEPAKTSYFVGDEFTSAGLEVEAVYSDLHRETLNASDYELSIAEGKALVAGDSGEVTVILKSDNSKTCTFDISVAEIVLQSLEVSTPTKHEYVKGATFDPSTITVTAHYNDERVDKVVPFKTSEEVDGYTLNYDFSAAGTDKTVTVSYGGQDEVLEGFTVLDIEVVKIELISGPSSAIYYEGQSFDRSRIGVKATFNNETVDEDFTEYQVSPEGPYNSLGNFDVTIYFNASGTEIPSDENLKFITGITVQADSVVSIALNHSEDQFDVGETFSYNDIKAIATHKSGKVDDPASLDQAFIYAPDDTEHLHPLNESEPYTFVESDYGKVFAVDAWYATKVATYTVTLRDSVKTVEVKEGSTHKVSFKSGETFSRENLVLHGVWYSGYEDDLTTDIEADLDGHVFTDADVENSPLTVTVTYGNSVECKYEISVNYDGLIVEGQYLIKANTLSADYYLGEPASGSSTPPVKSDFREGLVFDFELVASNTYTVKSGTKYLYTTDANNGLRVGDTESSWVITQNGDTYHMQQVEFSRYLAIYTSSSHVVTDFRTYTSVKSGETNSEIMFEAPLPVSGISLNKSESTLEVPNTETLVPTVSPDGAYNKSVTWSSSDESIATVDENGVVTAVSNGNVTITATTVDGNHTATCDYVITRPAAGSITLSASLTEIVMNTGTSTLSYTVGPAGAADPGDIEYVVVSGGESISIEGNVVSATAVIGSAVIKAHSDSLSLDSNEVTISVTDGTIHVSSVSLNETEFSLVLGMATLQLEETVLPANATDKSVTWESDDPSVATVNATGLVTTVGVGFANITVTTNDGSKTASCALTVLSDKGYVEENPFTPAEARAHWDATQDDSTTYYVEGFVKTIVTSVSSKTNGYISVYLDGNGSDLELFKMTVTSEQYDSIQVGTKIKASGTMTKYNTTYEFAQGCLPISITNTDVYSIEISGDSSVKPTEHIQLTATAKPTGASLAGLEWSSSDDSIATVDSTGKVTGVTNGDVVITASINGIQTTHNVSVSSSSIETLNITYSGSDVDMVNDQDYASTLGLPAGFTFIANKNSASTACRLWNDGSFRLYQGSGNGGQFTIAYTGTIKTLTLGNTNNLTVYVNGEAVTPTSGVYTINASSLIIKNTGSSNNTSNKSIILTYIG